MTTAYVYKLIHKENNSFYIGYRRNCVLTPIEDLQEYQSSSKYIKEIGFHNFNCEIIKIFDDSNEAYNYEQKLIKENFKNKKCLNLARETKDGNIIFKSKETTKIIGNIKTLKTKKHIKKKTRLKRKRKNNTLQNELNRLRANTKLEKYSDAELKKLIKY